MRKIPKGVSFRPFVFVGFCLHFIVSHSEITARRVLKIIKTGMCTQVIEWQINCEWWEIVCRAYDYFIVVIISRFAVFFDTLRSQTSNNPSTNSNFLPFVHLYLACLICLPNMPARGIRFFKIYEPVRLDLRLNLFLMSTLVVTLSTFFF